MKIVKLKKLFRLSPESRRRRRKQNSDEYSRVDPSKNNKAKRKLENKTNQKK